MTHRASQNILVTGGAGFIGSSLIRTLLDRGHQVTAVDRSPISKKWRLDPLLSLDNFHIIQLDLLDIDRVNEVVKGSDIVYHLAATTEVRKGQFDTSVDYLNNTVGTRNILESMRSTDRCKKIIFTSSSVVYGEPSIIPTPENYGPLKPISLYGASKLASEAYISAYVGSFGIRAIIFRLANIVGHMSEHGVIFDFFKKLKQSDGKYLEVLGDGKQKKSYLYIDDCITALIYGLDQNVLPLEIYNVGSDDQVDTNTIASMIISEMGLSAQIKYRSEQRDGRGWLGDVKDMLLLTDKLKKRGWKNSHSSKDSVYLTIKKIIEQKPTKSC